jgi:hypothetical protein
MLERAREQAMREKRELKQAKKDARAVDRRRADEAAPGSPFIAGIVLGRIDRGELDPRLQEASLRGDDAKVETLFFHVGSRQSGFVLRPDEFERGYWQGEEQLAVQLGNCVVSVLVAGELGRALER